MTNKRLALLVLGLMALVLVTTAGCVSKKQNAPLPAVSVFAATDSVCVPLGAPTYIRAKEALTSTFTV